MPDCVMWESRFDKLLFINVYHLVTGKFRLRQSTKLKYINHC